MDDNKNQETTPGLVIVSSEKSDVTISPAENTNIPSSSNFKSLKTAAFISLGYFGLLAVIAGLTLVEGMFAWFLLGWAMFLPVYIGSVGGVLVHAFVNKYSGGREIIWLGMLMGCGSCVLAFIELRKVPTSFDESGLSAYLLFSTLCGIFGIYLGIKSYRIHKVAGILVIILAASFIWITILVNDSKSKFIAVRDSFVPIKTRYNNPLGRVDRLPYSLYVPADQGGYTFDPNLMPSISSGFITTLYFFKERGTENYRGDSLTLVMSELKPENQLTPDTTLCDNISKHPSVKQPCTFLGKTTEGGSVLFHIDSPPRQFQSGNYSSGAYTYYFTRGNTYFSFEDYDLFFKPEQAVIEFVNSLQSVDSKKLKESYKQLE